MGKQRKKGAKSSPPPAPKRGLGRKHLAGIGVACGLVVGVFVFRQNDPPPKPAAEADAGAEKKNERPRFRPNAVHKRPADGGPTPLEVKTQPLVEKATAALDKSDYPAALEAAHECLRINPSSHACFDAQIFAYGRSGDFETAKKALEECLAEDPDDVDCLSGMINEHLRVNEIEAAKKKADRIRWLVPDTLSSWMADAQVAEATNDLKGALQFYERACAESQPYACNRADALRGQVDAGRKR